MAYRFEAKVIGMATGSAVHRAAYHARTQLHDDRHGRLTNDYSHKGDLAFFGGFIPKDAPEWAHDQGRYWNAAEKAERQANGQVARDWDLALPNRLSREGQKRAITDMLREQATRKGFGAWAALHSDYDDKGNLLPGRDPAEPRNDHVHVMLSTRKIGADGFARTKTDSRAMNSKEQLAEWRAAWARHCARQLRREGQEQEAARWEHGHLTLDRQREAALARGDHEWAAALDREPEPHMGPAATAMEKRGQRTDQGDARRAIQARNAERKALREAFQETKAELDRIEREERRAAKIEQAKAAQASTKGAKIDARRQAGHTGSAPLRPSGSPSWSKIEARRQAMEARHRAAQENRDETWARFREDRVEGKKALAESYKHAIDRVWNPEPAAKPTGPDLSPWQAVNEELQRRDAVYRTREQSRFGRTLNALYHVRKGEGLPGFLRLLASADERRKAFEREQRRTRAELGPKGPQAKPPPPRPNTPSPKGRQSEMLKERRDKALAEYDRETAEQRETLKAQHRQERAAEKIERQAIEAEAAALQPPPESQIAAEPRGKPLDAGNAFRATTLPGDRSEATQRPPDANSDPSTGGAGDPAGGKPDGPGEGQPHPPDPRQAEIDALRAWREARDAEGREQGGRERGR